MLTYLKIKNFITISDCEIDFTNKLNVITGESGAGKSIIFNAIEHLFGKASNQGFIKTDATSLEIEGIFKLSHSETLLALSDFLDEENPNQFCIYRKVDRHKNIVRINNKPVTLKLLKELTSSFAVIISQHHQLMLEKHHYLLSIIDSFFSTEDISLLNEYKEEYKQFIDIKQALSDFQKSTNLNQSLDFLEFQIQDISQHHFKIDEELELDQQKRTIKNQEKYLKNFNIVRTELTNAKNSLSKINSKLSQLSDLKTFESYFQQLSPIEDLFSELDNDITLEMNTVNDLSYKDINSIEERLDIIFKLKLKYKVNTLNDLIELQNNLIKQKDNLASFSDRQDEFLRQLNVIKTNLSKKAQLLHQKRLIIAASLSKDIVKEAKELCLGTISIQLKCEFYNNEFDSYGASSISFLTSLNPGTPLKEISKVASGGELSRLLLCIYAVIANQSPQAIFLFDEIDTGVGGITANHIGKKLHELSKSKQLFCITHLAQIAQHADEHILVKKQSDQSHSESSFILLSDQEKHNELHRMVGGEAITEKLFIN